MIKINNYWAPQGFGDAFPNVEYMRWKKQGIGKASLETLQQRQQKFGPIIAKTNRPFGY